MPRFNCLGIKRENYPVVALSLPASSFTDGLLGMDFLREVGAIIDVELEKIKDTLHPRQWESGLAQARRSPRNVCFFGSHKFRS